MPKLDERISSLETKLKQLKTRQARIDARKKSLASRRARQDDTRRKILLGATVLARISRGELDQANVDAWLDAALTRPQDRELFGLPIGGAAPPHRTP
ncbi:MAG: mobilization protein [Steroidobacteraceae bacterium]